MVLLPLGWRDLLEVLLSDDCQVSPVPLVFSEWFKLESLQLLVLTCWQQILACSCPTDLFLCSHLNKHVTLKKTCLFVCIFTFHFPPFPSSLFFKVVKTLSHSKIALSHSKIKRRETQKPQKDATFLPFPCPKHNRGSDCLNNFWNMCFLIMVQHSDRSVICI